MQQVRRMILQKREMNRRRRYVGYDFDGGLSGGNEYCRYCEQKSAVVDADGTGIIGGRYAGMGRDQWGAEYRRNLQGAYSGDNTGSNRVIHKKSRLGGRRGAAFAGNTDKLREMYGGCPCGAFLMAVFSVVLLVLRKAKKDTKLPFIPFLAMGWFLGLFLTGSIYTLQTV